MKIKFTYDAALVDRNFEIVQTRKIQIKRDGKFSVKFSDMPRHNETCEPIEVITGRNGIMRGVERLSTNSYSFEWRNCSKGHVILLYGTPVTFDWSE